MRKWITTVSPPVEEGNNTGEAIQGEAMSAVNTLWNGGSDLVQFHLSALNSRAAQVKLYLKSPGIEDRLLALQQSDRMEVYAA